MKLFDSHAHIVSEEFDSDRVGVLEECERAGVVGILNVSTSAEDLPRVVNLGDRFPILKPAIGIHPERIACVSDIQAVEEVEAVEKLLRAQSDRVFGISEVGLDFSPHVLRNGHGEPECIKARQRSALERQAVLAKEFGLPMSVHSRSAGKHTLKLLQNLELSNVVMHAFDGRPIYALKAVEESSFMFSVPPSASRSEHMRKLVERLPLENLLLETDAPALGPVQRTRNVPSNIVHSLTCVAEVKSLSEEEVGRRLLMNSEAVFTKAFKG
ncbi:hypothetical protein NDN08_008228 [Rhodosorus marinus]|uniref:TatD related DNase n=1 Tax=Rhodosorus marinus TaxID=101924 RepID=A0AAV8UZR9_9RHOD|nr:hypothetical protein NDN08_008228 [Rhodosorus marinus]